MKTSIRDLMDKALNWPGGSYVGLATLTIVGLAVAQYAAGEPQVLRVNDRDVVYMVHRAPEWFVGGIGIYTVILGLFAAGKPISALVTRGQSPPPPATQ
jgi:hypothetical protein